MTKNKNPVRNREKDRNFAGLYAVTNEYAYKNGKLRPEVYGYVTKDLPYVCKPSNKKGQPPQFKHDMTGKEIPKVLKNRMLAFFSDVNHKNKNTCWLAEKSVYEEMTGRSGSKRKKKQDPDF